MREKWRTFRSLPRELRRALLEALFMLPVARFGLATIGVTRTQRLLSVLPLPRLGQGPVPPDPSDIARMTATAASLLPLGLDCLPRALVTSRLLSRLGLPSELRIGVAEKSGGLPEAHAWVEHEGRILDSTPEETRRFAAFDALPREPGSPVGHPSE